MNCVHTGKRADEAGVRLKRHRGVSLRCESKLQLVKDHAQPVVELIPEHIVSPVGECSDEFGQIGVLLQELGELGRKVSCAGCR